MALTNDLKHTPRRSFHGKSHASGFRRFPVLYHASETAPHLDGAYAAFGKVTEGMDAVNKIAETADTDYSDRPDHSPGDEPVCHRGNLWRRVSGTGKMLILKPY